MTGLRASPRKGGEGAELGESLSRERVNDDKRAKHGKERERARRSLASEPQYKEGEGRPEPPRRIVTILCNRSELGGDLLEIKEEGLNRC